MREIKYNFWCEEKKRMYKWIENFEDMVIVNGELKPVLNNSVDNNWNWYKANYIPLQYTGFKDKNGKEIYEGDILARDGYWSIRIDYKNGCCVVRDLDKVRYNNKILDIPLCEYKSINRWEIIGNIYQNSKLLEREDNAINYINKL